LSIPEYDVLRDFLRAFFSLDVNAFSIGIVSAVLSFYRPKEGYKPKQAADRRANLSHSL